MNFDYSKCTGCSACKNICPKNCIEMCANDEGFLYPKINENICINCLMCQNVCPLNQEKKNNAITKAYAIKNDCEKIRLESTSGGFFSVLAEYVLENDGLVCGAVYLNDYTVSHILIDNLNDLDKMRGAKYSQSDLGDIFYAIKEKLDLGKIILFSGTPCQVEGLNSYLRRDYNNLITLDLICHGVPSPKIWNEYVLFRSKKDNNGILPNKINLRSKVSGWSKYNYSVNFDYGDNQYLIKNSDDIFMRGFVNDLYLRESCYNCSFKGIKRNSDFTLGDYWGVWNQIPEIDDDKGVSLVFIHSKKGLDLLNVVKDKIEYIEVDCEKSVEENQSALLSANLNKKQRIIIDGKKEIDEIIKEYVYGKKSNLFDKILVRLKIKK